MFERATILARLRQKIASGIPIIGAGAGTGISASCEQRGGADLIIIYNSGRYRMANLGSLAGMLAFGNANDIVIEMASEVIPVATETPVIAGVNAVDPRYPPRSFLRTLRDVGFSGVQNYPTVGLIDGMFRAGLEESGLGYDKEVQWIAAAHEAGVLTTPYVFDQTQARQMTDAGADIVVAHMGLTTGGTIGAKTALTLDESVNRVRAIATMAKTLRRDVIVICHGGPISAPEDAQYVLDRVPECDGFYGASSMERHPVETAMTAHVQRFADIRRKPV